MNARTGLILATVLVTLPYGTVSAQDRKIQQADLPPGVQKALAAHTRGATIKGLSQETEDGKTMYEVETTVNGHTRDLLLDASGALVEAEEEVAMATLPAPVQAGLTKAAGKGKITRVESLTRQGRLAGYEAVVSTNGKDSAIEVGPTGNAVTAKAAKEEKDEEEEDEAAEAKKPARAPARKAS